MVILGVLNELEAESDAHSRYTTSWGSQGIDFGLFLKHWEIVRSWKRQLLTEEEITNLDAVAGRSHPWRSSESQRKQGSLHNV